MLYGCDISHYQGMVDFDALRGHVAFGIAKATQGTTYVDPLCARNISEMVRVGIIPGAYHFAGGGDPVTEANFFLDHVTLPPGGLLFLDWEISYSDPVGWCRSFLHRVEGRTGVKAPVYLNQSIVGNFPWAPVIADDYGLWLAQYDNNPASVAATKWPVVAFKQYTSRGSLPGIVGPVDLDVFYGDAAALAKYGLPGAAPKPAPAPPAPPASAPAGVYTVQRGDTLTSIGQRFGVSVADLARWNGIANPNLIYPGEKLRLSGAAPHSASAIVHIVRAGENLTLIARNNGVSVNEVVGWNHLANPNVIFPGQHIIVGWR